MTTINTEKKKQEAQPISAATSAPEICYVLRMNDGGVHMLIPKSEWDRGMWRERATQITDDIGEPLTAYAFRAAGVPHIERDADNYATIAVIQFVLETEKKDSSGMDYLRLWNEGEFDKCRKEWPEAPDECYIGADVLFKPRKK